MDQIKKIWGWLSAACGRSLTIASGYVSLILGEGLGNLDAIADIMGDPQLHDQIQSLIGHDPSLAAGYAKVYGMIMIATRLRSKLMAQKV